MVNYQEAALGFVALQPLSMQLQLYCTQSAVGYEVRWFVSRGRAAASEYSSLLVCLLPEAV